MPEIKPKIANMKKNLSVSYFLINNLLRQIKCYLGLLIGILCFNPLLANPTELATKYSIHILGANVGEFSISQMNDNGNINIEAITNIKVKLLFSYQIKYIQNTVYEKGILKSSDVKTYKNGRLNSNMSLKFEDNSYLIVIDDDTTYINDLITYSGSLIYFNEPVGKKRLYKERTAEMKELTFLEGHTYIINDKKNKELSRYIYKDGILEYAKMRHTLGNIELKRKTEN